MALTSSVLVNVHIGGGKSLSAGTFTQSAATDSGGDIATGLSYVDFFAPVCNSHLGTEVIKVTYRPTSYPGSVTLVTSTGAVSGYWIAIGLG